VVEVVEEFWIVDREAGLGIEAPGGPVAGGGIGIEKMISATRMAKLKRRVRTIGHTQGN